MKLKPIYIGKLKIPKPLFLAPMAGITDLPFRIWAKKYGAGVLITEMISAKACTYKSGKTLNMMRINKCEHPCGIQIFGDNLEDMISASSTACDMGADFININLGCPAPKVLKSGGGFALMSGSGRLKGFFEELVKKSRLPVTVKLRLGSEKDPELYKIIAEIVDQTGISAIMLHCRLKEQRHSGEADYSALKEIKQITKIPVIANGGIDSPEKAYDIYSSTFCDGFMVGQYAIANPWIFKDIEIYFKSKKKSGHKKNGIMLFRELLELNREFYISDAALVKLRKIFPLFTKGIKNSASIRKDFFRLDTYSLMLDYINSIC